MLRRYFLTSVAVLTGLAVLGTASSANADFRMRIESGTTIGPGVVITDNGPGDNQSSIGAIGFSGAITAQFSINSSIGTTTPTAVLPGYFDGIDLNNLTINSTGAGVLRLILEQTGFNTAPNGNITLQQEVGGVLTAGAGSTIKFQSFAANGSAVPNLGLDQFPTGALSLVTGIGPGDASVTQTFGPGAFNGTAGTNFNKTGTYSMYEVVTVTFTSAGSVSFNGVTGTAPAPAGLVLALTGMPVLGLGAWVRRRRASTPA